MQKYYCSIIVLIALTVAPSTNPALAADTATVVVAAADSSQQAKQQANLVCDGNADQQEINTAIQSLPASGGTVLLMEGNYEIRKVTDTLGGIIIDHNKVTLAGQGSSTKLKLAANQNTNVLRIIGSGIGHITIRDLWIDANRAENSEGRGDPNVSHARFEFCGIKAFYTFPGGPTGERNHNITIQNCWVLNSQRLGIMLEGANMKVINNTIGNAGSDAVEILTGPGEIRGNYFEITGQTHVAVGSDRGDSIIMANNIVHVKAGGKLDIGFRSWANSLRHVIADNILTVDPGGHCALAMDIRGTGATVTGNSIHTASTEPTMRLKIAGGAILLTGNLLENLIIEVNDTTQAAGQILIQNNLLKNSTINHINGNYQSTTK